MKPDQLTSLTELIEKLPKDLQDRTGDKYLSISQMRKVLDLLQKEGYYTVIKESKKTKRPGRPKSYENISYTREGHPRSMYKITEQVVKLQKFLSNSAVQGYVHSRLKKHGLSQQFFKFLTLSSMYALRDEVSKEKIFDWFKIFPLADEFLEDKDSRDFINTIHSLDETQLNLIAEKISSFVAENHLFHIYSLNALPK